jgi:hypothetical protein
MDLAQQKALARARARARAAAQSAETNVTSAVSNAPVTQPSFSYAKTGLPTQSDTNFDAMRSAEESATAFARSTTKPLIGAAQLLTPEDAGIQEDLAYASRETDKATEKAPVSGFLGETGTYLLGGGLLSKGLSKFKAINEIRKTGSLAKKTALSAGIGVPTGVTTSAAMPVTGETPEERTSQREMNTLVGGGISGAISIASPALAKGVKTLADYVALSGAVGKGAAEKVALKKLSEQYDTFIAEVNKAKKAVGEPEINPGDAVNNIDATLSDIQTFNQKYGTSISASAVNAAKAPELTAFLATYKGDEVIEFLKVGNKERNNAELAKVVQMARENANPAVKQAAQNALAKKSRAEVNKLGQMTGAEEGLIGAPKSIATPEQLSRGGVDVSLGIDAAKKAEIKAAYDAVNAQAKTLPIMPDVLKKEIAAITKTLSGSVAKNDFMAALPKEITQAKKPLTYADIDTLYQRVNEDYNASPSDTLLKVKNFLGQRDTGLKDKIIANSGNTELKVLKANADKINKEFEDLGRGTFTDDTGKVIAQRASEPVSSLRSMSQNKKFTESDWLNTATKNQVNVDETLRAYPESKPYIESYYTAKLAALADLDGSISEKQLNKFMVDNADSLSHPELASVKADLDMLQAGADKAGRSNIAKAYENKLSSPAFADSLWGNEKLRRQVVKFATDSGTLPNLRNAARESIQRKILNVTDAGAEIKDRAAFTKNLSNEVSKERVAFDDIFGKGESNSILEALNILKDNDFGKQYLDTINKSPDVTKPVLEFLGITLGSATPAQITRAGSVSTLIGKDAFNNVARGIATNPEYAKEFIKLSQKPDLKALEGFLAKIEQGNVGANAAIASTLTTDKTLESTVQSPEDDVYRLGKDSKGTFNAAIPQATTNSDVYQLRKPSTGGQPGKVPQGEPLKIEIRPQSLNDLAPVQKQVVKLAQQAAPKAGVDTKGFINTLNIESNLGANAGQNPRSTASGVPQITDGTWDLFVKKYGQTAGVTNSMRGKPEAEIKIAAFIYKDAVEDVKKILGRQPNPAEAYMGYKLGKGNSDIFFGLLKRNPKAIPAKYIQAAATSNPEFFYNGNTPLTAGEVYARYVKRYKEKAIA